MSDYSIRGYKDQFIYPSESAQNEANDLLRKVLKEPEMAELLKAYDIDVKQIVTGKFPIQWYLFSAYRFEGKTIILDEKLNAEEIRHYLPQALEEYSKSQIKYKW
jgi:hypothetical protein